MSKRNHATASSAPDLLASLQVPFTMTKEQNEPVVGPLRQKPERQMAATEVEAELNRELMKALDVRTVSSAASASAA